MLETIEAMIQSAAVLVCFFVACCMVAAVETEHRVLGKKIAALIIIVFSGVLAGVMAVIWS